MNCSVVDEGGGILAISQFTLYGDCRRGRRPSFTSAAQPEEAERLYEAFIARLESHGIGGGKRRLRGSICAWTSTMTAPVTLLVESESTLTP